MTAFAHGEFIGNLVDTLDLREYGKGKSMARGRLAVNCPKKNSEGEWENNPLWVNFAYFGMNAEDLAEKMEKGDTVLVAGRLEPNEYEKNDTVVKSFSVNATTLQAVSKRGEKQEKAERKPEKQTSRSSPF